MRPLLRGLAESQLSVAMMELLLTIWLEVAANFKKTDYSDPRITIVIPARNVENYIRQTIRSIRAQRYKNLEVILVDDGSTDQTATKALSYGKALNLRVFGGPGKGPGAARNQGLKNVSKTDYVMFLDSDDILPPGTLSGMVRLAKISGADIVKGQSARFVGLAIARRRDTRSLYKGYSERVTTLKDCPELIYDSSCANELISWRFWNKNEFAWAPDGYFEDLILASRMMTTGAKIAVTSKISYLWRVRVRTSQSITQTHSAITTLKDRVTASRLSLGYMEEALSEGRIDKRTLEAFRGKLRTHDLPIYLTRYPNPNFEARTLLDELRCMAGE